MAPVSMSWGPIHSESPRPQSEPSGPFALADVLGEVLARYTPPPAPGSTRRGAIVRVPAAPASYIMQMI